MPVDRQFELLGLNIQELRAIFAQLGEPSYRARQLFEAVYRQRLQSPDQVTTLPLELRQKLSESYTVGVPRIEQRFESQDGTIRYLMALGDGELVETVWMPDGDGGERGDTEPQGRSTRPFKGGTDSVGMTRDIVEPEGPLTPRGNVVIDGMTNPEDGFEGEFDRATICVSSQVGCAVNCQFCMTALLGVKRSLTAGEIVGQIIAVLNDRSAMPGCDRINLVFMGMGEPFLNYDNFMKAVRLLVEGAGIPESRMTVSTAGIVPRIYDFGKEPVRPKLAISLNASNDQQRAQLMPINRKWNLRSLLAAAREFPLRPRERLTFEYVLLDGVNDMRENATEVARLLRGLRAKVNLIALNPGPEIPFGTPSEERILNFQQTLINAGISTFIRRPRGRDIYAACGQLKQQRQAAGS